MRIYDTLSKQLKELPSPEEQKQLKMFVCGPTVYDYVHLGNARTFAFFDVVAKYLKHKGHNVEYIQNITDIDNKIIDRAEKEGIDALEYAKKYTEIFKQDMAALGVTAPEYKNATDHIPEVIKQVQTLLDKGHAYVIEGDGIYFDLSTFPDYGQLSGRTAQMADDAVSRIDDSDKKRNRGDFALWKFKQDNDPSWPAPFGAGRPGWHIEDTAITEKYFGPQYDIHGGGQDLKFPHHEAEIAQEESASGKKPFVKIWMHAGFLVNKEEKMSKSLGNFSTLHDMLQKHSAETIRFYFLTAHYRSSLDFDEKNLEAAEQGVKKIVHWLAYMELVKKQGFEPESGLHVDLDGSDKYVSSAMDDDFNVPAAMSAIFTVMNVTPPALEHKTLGAKEAEKLQTWVIENGSVFGIVPKLHHIPADIHELAEKREAARRDKNFEESDRLREELSSYGYAVDDTPYGPLVTLK